MQAPQKLKGIVEVDETYVLESHKGQRKLGRKASKRDLSSEQVPILMAADRSGTTFSTVLPTVTADMLKQAISAQSSTGTSCLCSTAAKIIGHARRQWGVVMKPSICQPVNGSVVPFIFRLSTAATVS